MQRYFNINNISDLLGGELSNIADPNKRVENVNVRPTSCDDGSLYVPYYWPPYLTDCDRVLWRAFQIKNALVAIVSRDYDPGSNFPLIRVDDVNASLEKLAMKTRAEFKGKLIGITGTVGKSSTKAMLGQVLAQNGKTWTTKANQNLKPHVLANLCELSNRYQYAAMEIGMVAARTLSETVSYVRPDIAVITEIGIQHTEGFSDPHKGVFWEKCEILRKAKPGATAILPSISARFEEMHAIAKTLTNISRIIVCGERAQDDIQIVSQSSTEHEQLITLRAEGKLIKYKIPFPNRYIAHNSALVAGVLLALDLPLKSMRAAALTPHVHSDYLFFKSKIGEKSIEIVEDTFNSSPLSVRGLTEYIKTRQAKRKVILLASNPSLGQNSKAIHASYGQLLEDAGFHSGYFMGTETDELANKVSFDAKHFIDHKEAFQTALSELEDGDLVVLKGSVSGMKRLNFTKLIKQKSNGEFERIA